MIKPLLIIMILIVSLFQLGCGRKKSVDPDPQIETPLQNEIAEIFADSVAIVQTDKFFELEQTMEDIQKEVEMLRNKVINYEYKPPETDYTKQLKALIDNPPPAHKISLSNGSIIEGTIKKDKLDYLLVNTDVGLLTLNKSEILEIEDLILPTPDLVFIGHGQEEAFESYRLFTGKVMNQGNRRGDFVRVIYNLWGENTQLLGTDSTFIEGSQIIYRSGIVTDTVLEPNQSAQFSIKVAVPDSISVTYVTRDVRWEMFD
ncbi:MAG: hypothetical protein H8E85_05290 [Candidatus Marinimicrobia bacterium]|nr:hypothetical protein [Candidatus Neomarinimicrobiota bacterium]